MPANKRGMPANARPHPRPHSLRYDIPIPPDAWLQASGASICLIVVVQSPACRWHPFLEQPPTRRQDPLHTPSATWHTGSEGAGDEKGSRIDLSEIDLSESNSSSSSSSRTSSKRTAISHHTSLTARCVLRRAISKIKSSRSSALNTPSAVIVGTNK